MYFGAIDPWVVWAPVAAALGASLLTTVGLLGRDYFTARRERRDDKLKAYEALLARSMAVVQTALALRLTMQLRSGLQDGVEVALHQRQPLDPFDLADRLAGVYQPLFEAHATVLASGSPDAILLSNELLDRCLDLLGLSTEGGQARGKVARYVFGERWTQQKEEDYFAAITALGEVRVRLATLIRVEGRAERVDVAG